MISDRLDQSQPRPAADPTPAEVLTVDPAPGTLSPPAPAPAPAPNELVLVEHGPISDRVQVYHNIARSCAAYAVFYGAMAGQELIALRQKVGSRKFQPTLTESMPWLAVSTAYLYIGYADRFAARLAAILPSAGRIELRQLPDPRDYEAAEKSDLFAQVRESTGVDTVEQMWLALGLMKEPRGRGGDTSKFPRKTKPTEEQLHAETLEAWTLLVNDLQGRAFGNQIYKVEWDRLTTPELADLDDRIYRVHQHLRDTLKARQGK